MATQCKTWFLALPKRPTTRIPHKATKVCEKLFEKRSLGVNGCGGWLVCVFNPVYSVVALSAAGGHVLWRKVMPAPVIYIQSGLQYPSQLSPVVLLISRSTITAINGTTGENATLLRTPANPNTLPATPQGRLYGQSCWRTSSHRQSYFQTSREIRSRIFL